MTAWVESHQSPAPRAPRPPGQPVATAGIDERRQIGVSQVALPGSCRAGASLQRREEPSRWVEGVTNTRGEPATAR